MEKSVGATNAKVRNHIPEDLAFSILSKLPLKSLKRFGCVRKSWALLFENLHFLNMYRNYFISNNHSYYDGTSILLKHIKNPLPDEAFHSMFQSMLYLLSGQRFENMVKLDWPPPFHEDDSFIDIVGNTSVNGILCLSQGYFLSPNLVFWNPTIDEFKVIPSSPFMYRSRYIETMVIFHGFGYDHVRDDYKVFRLLSFDPLSDVDYYESEEYVVDRKSMWEIYSLRSNSWRKLDIKMDTSGGYETLYVDGVCHWMDGHDNDMNFEPRLVSFDLCSEISLTTPFPVDMVERYDILQLILLNGCIAFIKYDKPTIHITILGELGVKESWAKLFIVETLPCIDFPIGAGKKGDIFFRKDDGELVLFDLSTQMIKELGVKGNPNYSEQIIIYKDSVLPIGGL